MAKNNDYMHGLSANERAIIERIPILPLRKFVAGMVRAKMRVQFTGWLQYLLPVIFILILALLAGVSLLLKISFLVSIFSTLGGLILLIALFDLVTVKFKIRFPERLPQRNDDLDLFDLPFLMGPVKDCCSALHVDPPVELGVAAGVRPLLQQVFVQS